MDAASAVPQASPTNSGEICRIMHYDPLRIELAATLDSPGLVVLSEQFFPGWRLDVRSDDSPVLRELPSVRTNGILRGAFLPEGRHHLVYRYRPSSFAYGAAISIAAWLALLVVGLKRLTSRRTRQKDV